LNSNSDCNQFGSTRMREEQNDAATDIQALIREANHR
jgi:hypothetical protein